VHESFDLPDALSISPGAGFSALGPVGGPFSPGARTLMLTNSGGAPLTWSMGHASSWLTVWVAEGELTPGGPATPVLVSLNGSASSLPAGIYSDTVRFTNLTSGIEVSRPFVLRIGQPDYFTEIFDAGDNDLDFSTITFTPDGSVSFYAPSRQTATNFPSDPDGGTVLALSDDSFEKVTLSGTNTVAIYNRRSNVFYIGSNGYLTLDSGDTKVVESLTNHFNRPRISGLFDDLNFEDGGTLSWKELADRVAVTYQNVPEYGRDGSNSFQIEMFYDGAIRLTWLRLDSRGGLTGLSRGTGVPVAFVESDLSNYGTCPPPPVLSLEVTNNAARLTWQGVGSSQPLSPGSDPESRARNRRVEIIHLRDQ